MATLHQQAGAAQRQAATQFQRYVDVPKEPAAAELAATLQTRWRAYQSVLDELAAAVDAGQAEPALAAMNRAQQAEHAFQRDMEAFLARVQAHSDEVRSGAEDTHVVARWSAIALAALGVLLTLAGWLFVRRAVLRPCWKPAITSTASPTATSPRASRCARPMQSARCSRRSSACRKA